MLRCLVFRKLFVAVCHISQSSVDQSTYEQVLIFLHQRCDVRTDINDNVNLIMYQHKPSRMLTKRNHLHLFDTFSCALHFKGETYTIYAHI